MNAEELKTFSRSTRRRLFAWEVIKAVDAGILGTTTGYFDGLTVPLQQCRSCAIGAGYVFSLGWHGPKVEDMYQIKKHRAMSMKYMREMGFNTKQIDIIEYLFEPDEMMPSWVVYVAGESYWCDLKYRLHHAESRLARMRKLYQWIFDSPTGFIEENKGEMYV